jgi:phospho-N-acetylmuramoyl-pentapeptide-transferase
MAFPTFNFIHAQEITSLSRLGAVAMGSFVLSMILTPIYTRMAFKYKWWKQIRSESTTGEIAAVFQKLHAEKHKRNIPTFGGAVSIISVAVVTILFNFSRNQTWLPVFVLIVFGLLGLVDDYSNVYRRADKRGGLTPRTQLLVLGMLSALAAAYFYYKLSYNMIHVPAVGDFSIGWLYIPLFIAVVVSTTKAVSITDGLDGLAGGLLSTAFSVYAVIAYFQHNYGIAGFCATIVGAMLTYTWFNIYPARFFMGQTGSTALGAALGAVAMLTNTVFVLPIIAAVFVVEAGSSAIQIASKKIFKRKIFRSAPLHHHLEAIGWPETRVTMRLWIIGQVVGGLGLILALLGNKVG